MKIEVIKINKLIGNNGQINGLPKNPRIIRDAKFEKLKQSIIDDPEMLELREVIAYDNNGELVVIAGNMRLKASQEVGIKEVPCKILPQETSVAKLRAYIIKDNVSFGENNWDDLANEWDSDQLEEWGMDVWKQEEDVDYSLLDDEDLSDEMQGMTDGVKKAIQIEFEAEHYEEAQELVKFWRGKEMYIGYFLLEQLRNEKAKLEPEEDEL